MGKDRRIPLGKRKTLKINGYMNGYVEPHGKFWKRLASKKVRRTAVISNGTAYRKIWGPFEWC